MVLVLAASCADKSWGREVRIMPAQTNWSPAQAPVSEGFVDIDGVKLWYCDTGGNGTPVVLLHPFTGSALIWGYQQSALVDAGFRVIAYSRRGHYQSDVICHREAAHPMVVLDALHFVKELTDRTTVTRVTYPRID